jgi:hypothetical protein
MTPAGVVAAPTGALSVGGLGNNVGAVPAINPGIGIGTNGMGIGTNTGIGIGTNNFGIQVPTNGFLGTNVVRGINGVGNGLGGTTGVGGVGTGSATGTNRIFFPAPISR